MDELKHALSAGIPGALALVGASYLTGWPADCLLAIGIVLAAVAVAILLVWLVEQAVQQWREVVEVSDRVYMLAKEARSLTPEQIRFINSAAHLGRDVSLTGETYMHGTEAPLWFVEDFLARSFAQAACPIRTWNEGTDERKWASQITAALVAAGYALEPIGHYSARWVAGVTPDTIRGKLGMKPTPLPQVNADGYQEIK